MREVGGLADTVEDFKPGKNSGTGFVFKNYDDFSFLIALIRAHTTYGYKKEWNRLVTRTMTRDFSWKKSAKEYQDIFRLTLDKRLAPLE